MRQAAIAILVAVTLCAVAAGAEPGTPVGVSPGSASGELIGGACPAFSWGGMERAASYELVVYRVEEGREAQPVLRQRIPGSAYSWTPALGRCLEPGGRYAWSVRATGGEGDSAWSEPLLFQVAAGPGEAEFERALAVVERYLASRGGETEGIAGETAASSEERGESSAAATEPAALDGSDFSVDAGGNVQGASFAGDGSALTGVTAAGLACTDCVSEGELDFDPATQTELDASVAGHVHAGEAITTGTVDEARIDADIARDAEILPTVLAGDGAGSGLDADTLDGLEAAALESYVPDNLVRNSSFEAFSEGDDTYPDRWTHLAGEASGGLTSVSRVSPGTHGASAVEVADESLTVRYCLKQELYGAGELPAELEEETLRLSAWHRKSPASGVSVGLLGLDDGATRSETALADSTTWSRAALEHTLAPTADRLILELCPTGTNGAETARFRFDAVMLTVGSADPDYRPGPADRLAGESLSLALLHVEGDVGIGTLDPTEKLEVEGNVKATAFLGDGSAVTGVTAAGLACTDCVSEGELDFDPATQSELAAHAALANVHHVKTVDTHCDGAACDGTNFTHLQWAALESKPAGLDDGDDDTTYGAGPGLALTGTTFRLASGPALGPMGNTTPTVDSAWGVGHYTSITLGADGLPVMSYWDLANNDLKVAKCNDAACSGGDETLSTVDSGGDVGAHNSITLGADGLPVVSYLDATNGDLKVAKCNDPACTGGDETLSTVDSAGLVGRYPSITLGADGLPVVSYMDFTNDDLKVAKCNDPACSGGDETLSTVDSGGNVGHYSSITLGSDGLPVVSYWDLTNNDLKVAKCNDPACDPAVNGAETVSTVDSAGLVGQYTSITLGSDGLPVVSYWDESNGDLKVAKCNDAACSGGDETLSTVDSGGRVGEHNSISVGADGLPVVSYYDYTTQDLKVAKCNDPACSGGDETISTIDSGGNVGSATSVTVGADGLPVVSYHDFTNGHLKVARCGSAFCVPYLRRR